MIGRLPRTRILLLLLYRPEYVHGWGSKSYHSMIKELILNRAAGNPLFMEELTQSLLQNGSIRRTGDRFVLTRDIAGTQVPDTVQGIIAARMDRLEESLKEFCEMLAYHYSKSGNPAKGYAYLKKSAEKAERNDAVGELPRCLFLAQTNWFFVRTDFRDQFNFQTTTDRLSILFKGGQGKGHASRRLPGVKRHFWSFPSSPSAPLT